MTYILLYSAVLIAAMVGVGAVVARLPRVGTKNGILDGENWSFDHDEPSLGGLDASSQFHYGIDHRD